jgi:1-acyl-sn-glycerol-3-phosphate acyltransferase
MARDAAEPEAAPRTSPRAATLARRLVTVPALFVFFALVSALLPALVLAAVVTDAVRSLRRRVRGAATRLAAFLWFYLFAEVVGVLVLFGIWIATLGGAGGLRVRLIDGTYAVQRRWAGALFAAARALFALRFVLEDDPLVAPGPVLVFIRHASLVDTLLPTVFVTGRHGIRLRFVLKRELLADPCLDIAGQRIPNWFVARDGRETAAELAGVAALAAGLSAREGVLIYPEGTRFTPAKLGRALERLRAQDPERAARLGALSSVLPPRPGGALALLEGAPEADVVFFAHRGMGGFAEWRDIWRGGLVGRTVHVKLWRVPRREVPADRAARVAWLDAQWLALDRWVDAE